MSLSSWPLEIIINKLRERRDTGALTATSRYIPSLTGTKPPNRNKRIERRTPPNLIQNNHVITPQTPRGIIALRPESLHQLMQFVQHNRR